MNTILSNEIYWLILTILMTSVFWIPYILNRLLEQGVLAAFWDRYGYTDTQKDWARRMMQAHTNSIENLALFAPLVILIQISGVNSTATSTACMVYFFARLVHYFAFSFAVPLLRVVTFLIGFGVQIMLSLTLLGL